MSKILKGLNEVNPNNYDSDWDYQDAVAKSGKSRSNYRSQEDDTSDADISYSKKMYQLGQKQKAAKEKAQRDADHNRLASGTNEARTIDIDKSSVAPGAPYKQPPQENVPTSPVQQATEPQGTPIVQVQQLVQQLSVDSKKRLVKKLRSELGIVSEDQLDEISNDKLSQYKTAAATDAGKADKEGDYKRGDKRFSGIVKATNKQFANDKKKSNISQGMAEADEKQADPFKFTYPRVNNPKILGTQNRAKTAYYPPSKPNVKKLDKPLPENLGNELKSKSLEALQQVKQKLEQQRMAELEQWEQDFKQNTVSKFTAREPNLRQRATSTSMVAMPGEKHSELKTRLSQLDKAIEKQGILDNLVQKLDKKGLMTPNIEAGVDTSMLARDGARDNYVELNKKLDKALEYVKNRLLTNKAAYAKPKAIDENDSVPTRMKMSDYYDLADNIQEKLKQAIKIGDKARIQELNKQRDELDAHVKKHGMMPEAIDEDQLDELSCWSGYHRVAGTKAGFPGSCAKNKTNEEEIDEADMNRRGFLKGMGAAAVAGAAGGADAGGFNLPRGGSPTGSAADEYLTTNVTDKIKSIITANLKKSPVDLSNLQSDIIFVVQISVSADGKILSRKTSIKGDYNKSPNKKEIQILNNLLLNAIDEIKQLPRFTTSSVPQYYTVLFGFKAPTKTKESVNQGLAEEQHSCPHCGGEMVSEELMNEKKDACYYKVKSRYKVWPSAYASGALVKCRNKGASNWGNGGKKNESSILEGIEQADESLHDWFNKEKWVRMDTKGKIKGPCAREPGEGKPKCLPQSKAHSLGKKGRASAAQRKRREDPNPERSGKAINVNTKKSKG